MNRPSVPPFYGEESSPGVPVRRPSVPPRSPSIPPAPSSSVRAAPIRGTEIVVQRAKEDPVLAQRVSAFLHGFDQLPKEEKTAKIQALRQTDPALFTAVQGYFTRKNTQEARDRIEASQASRDSAREIDAKLTGTQGKIANEVKTALDPHVNIPRKSA